MPPIRNPSLSKFHRLVGNKESLAELLVRLFSGHHANSSQLTANAKSARILWSPPARLGSRSPIDAAQSLESGPSCLQWHQREEIPWEKESLGPTQGPALAACRHYWASFVGRFLLNMRSICHYLLPAGSSVLSFLNTPQAGCLIGYQNASWN